MTNPASVTTLSQANQNYINALNPRSTQETKNKQKLDFKTLKDEYKKTAKKRLKLTALAAGIALVGSIIIMAIKNPQKAKEALEVHRGKKIFEKNLEKFNDEKIFNEPIDLKKLYDKTAAELKDVELDYGFDEKTITDDNLLKKLESFGFYEPTQAMVNAFRTEPQKMHLLNLLSGTTKEEDKKYISYYFDKLKDSKCTQDEMETYFKLLKRNAQKTNDSYIFHGNDMKRTV